MDVKFMLHIIYNDGSNPFIRRDTWDKIDKEMKFQLKKNAAFIKDVSIMAHHVQIQRGI